MVRQTYPSDVGTESVTEGESWSDIKAEVPATLPTTLPSKSNAIVERIVEYNSSDDQAVQINAAIGEDMSKHIQRMEIRQNDAKGNSFQSNHPMSLEVLMALVSLQNARK